MSKVSVICCNDSVEFVCLNTASAEAKIEELALAHFNSRIMTIGGQAKPYAEYRETFYWHSHEVDAE